MARDEYGMRIPLSLGPPREGAGQNDTYDSVSGTEGDLAWCKHPLLRGR